MPLTLGTDTRAWHLTFHLLEVDIASEGLAHPAVSDELDARWFSLEDALQLQPVATGTDRILRTLAARLQP